MDESCPEEPEYYTIGPFRCACYNARQFCLYINLPFLPSSNADFRANTLPIMWNPKLNEEEERIYEISCYNPRRFAMSRCPIKFDLN